MHRCMWYGSVSTRLPCLAHFTERARTNKREPESGLMHLPVAWKLFRWTAWGRAFRATYFPSLFDTFHHLRGMASLLLHKTRQGLGRNPLSSSLRLQPSYTCVQQIRKPPTHTHIHTLLFPHTQIDTHTHTHTLEFQPINKELFHSVCVPFFDAKKGRQIWGQDSLQRYLHTCYSRDRRCRYIRLKVFLWSSLVFFSVLFFLAQLLIYLVQKLLLQMLLDSTRMVYKLKLRQRSPHILIEEERERGRESWMSVKGTKKKHNDWQNKIIVKPLRRPDEL